MVCKMCSLLYALFPNGSVIAPLVNAVSNAGGFGFLNPGTSITHIISFFLKLTLYLGYDPLEKFQGDLDKVREGLSAGEDGTYPFGVGFLCWILDKDIPRSEALIDLAISYNLRAIWFSFGNDVARWINYVRSKDPVLRNATKEPIKIFYLTSDVQDALRSVDEWGVDVLVVQGNEAGGHGSDSSPGLSTLLPEMMHAFRSKPQFYEAGRLKKPVILGAGGLATGDQIASVIVGGAAGVVLGTRFLLSPESGYTSEQKARLVAARSDDSVRTFAYDVARGTVGWPAGVDGRALTSEIVELYNNGADAETLKEKTKSISLVWAGSGVGLMNEIKPAGVSLLVVSTTP